MGYDTTEKKDDKLIVPGFQETLSQNSIIEEDFSPLPFKLVIFNISILFTVFVIWAYLTPVKEVIKANGNIIPRDNVFNIQHLGGGVIQEILVQNGDKVKEGDALLIFSTKSAQVELDKVLIKEFSIKERITVLDRMVDEDMDSPPEEFKDLYMDSDVKSKILNEALNAKYEEMRIIRTQIKQKRIQTKILQGKLKNLRKTLKIAKERFGIQERSYKEGLNLKSNYLESKSKYLIAKSEINKTKFEINQAKQGVYEFDQRLNFLAYSTKQRILEEIRDLKEQLYDVLKDKESLQVDMDGLVVRSPSNGVVNNFDKFHQGSVIRPGEIIMEIIPLDVPLIANIRINPEDMAHIKIGDPVDIKITSYDFSVYGSIEGQVSFLSAFTSKNEKDETFYNAKIKLNQQFVGSATSQNKLMAGMELIADIVTGEKTILQYLLKPIYLSLEDSFKEK